MDHKTWLWRKKSTEKTVASNEKANKGNEEEIGTDKADSDMKVLNEKLSFAIAECNYKDELVKENLKTAQEAIAGRERAETEAISLKQELARALQQKEIAEERSSHLDAALKECMQQLRFVREEQEQRIHDAVVKSSTELEKNQMVLMEKLEETRNNLGKLGLENSHLTKLLFEKEKVIEDLNECKTQAESDFNGLTARLDSLEKDNALLKYEVRVLQQELEIRNEEREFNRRTADASHKQHLESVKKIAKLESECQRLRLLVRKRLPGPAALAKMKTEVDLLGKDPADTRRRKSNYSPFSSTVEFTEDNSPVTPDKRIALLTERLFNIEEENKALKENLDKKADELQLSRTMFSRAASKLSLIETQLEESSKGQKITGPARHSLISQDLCQISISDVSSDDRISCSESWASALISELEHFKSGKTKDAASCKRASVSDINLMDDFVEMEKLAIVSVDEPSGSSDVSSNKSNAIVGPLKKEISRNSSGAKEMVLVTDDQSGLSNLNSPTQTSDISMGRLPGWLQSVLKVILEQGCASQRKLDLILEDIKVALAQIDNSKSKVADANENLNHLPVSPIHDGSLSSRSLIKFSAVDSYNGETGANNSPIENGKQFQPDLNKSLKKIIELIEGIIVASQECNTQDSLSGKVGSFAPYNTSETSAGYIVRLFQWKTSEISSILQQFVHICYDLLEGKVSLEGFVQELTSALEWTMNHCFSLQDVSSMRYALKKDFDSESESEAEIGTTTQSSEADKFHVNKEQPFLATAPVISVYNGLYQMEDLQIDLREENKKLKDELTTMQLAQKGLEERLDATIYEKESSITKLQESERRSTSLQVELLDQAEKYKLMIDDLNSQLAVARAELKEAGQRCSSLEVDLMGKNNSCEELEAKCLKLQVQLASAMKKQNLESQVDREEKPLRTDWEITAATEKLAECQETILNLGKQLKALASPGDAALFDKVMSSPIDTDATLTSTNSTTANNRKMSRRSSLLGQLLAEEDAFTKDLRYPLTVETVCTTAEQKSTAIPNGILKSIVEPDGAKEATDAYPVINGTKHNVDDAGVPPLAIVPSKKWGGGGLLKRLFSRRKKGSNKKLAIPSAAQL